MNYIIEINSFYDWLETNPVSDSCILLWHALMHVNNKTGWKEEFAVAISTLELKTSLSKSSIVRARNTLQQAGRINFRSREGQQSAVYSMVVFLTDTQSDTQTVTQTGHKVNHKPNANRPIPKLNKTKLNENSKSHSPAAAGAAEKKESPFWRNFVSVWNEWYHSKFNGSYAYMEKDFAQLKRIYRFLEKRAEEKKFDFTEENLLAAFKFFLNKAWEKDDWLRQNFSIPNVLSQFNQIANGKGDSKGKQATGANVSTGSILSKIAGMPN